jgi:hypothetical protein
MEEIIKTLPPSALVVFAAVLAVVYGSKMLGKFVGATTTAEGAPNTAQVAAVIVDNTVLKAATDNLVEALDKLCHEMSKTREEMRECRIEMRRMTDESIRRRS